jgi:WD40 repeat protein
LNFDLTQSSTVINDTSVWSIHFDLSNNYLYVASYWDQSIRVYNTNDEITFNKIATISTSYFLYSITTDSDKIYTGTEEGAILVYSKTSLGLIKVMDNMCSSPIYSVKYDCNGNMIYSCFNPPVIKAIGKNNINATLSVNDSFNRALEAFTDSKNRLWIGGNNAIVAYS